jgi:hypothetical protein
MQSQQGFVSSACDSFWAHRLGTLLGTLGAFFARSVQKTEGKREKAAVFLTVAFDEKRPRSDTGDSPRMIAVQLTIGEQLSENCVARFSPPPEDCPSPKPHRQAGKASRGDRDEHDGRESTRAAHAQPPCRDTWADVKAEPTVDRARQAGRRS